VLDAIDREFPWDSKFHLFAVRDLNVHYTEQDGSTGTMFSSGPKGVALPSDTPAHSSDLSDHLPLTNGATETQPVDVPGFLQARYRLISVAPEVRFVELDFSQLGPTVDEDAMVALQGNPIWQHRALSDHVLRYCLAIPTTTSRTCGWPSRITPTTERRAPSSSTATARSTTARAR
jgi:hypothetical protein